MAPAISFCSLPNEFVWLLYVEINSWLLVDYIKLYAVLGLDLLQDSCYFTGEAYKWLSHSTAFYIFQDDLRIPWKNIY